MLLSSPLPFSVRDLPFQTSLSLATPAGFPLPPHLCRHQNIFYRDFHLFIRCRMSPPQHMALPLYLKDHLPHTYVKNGPQPPPLRQCCLSPVQVGLERLCPHSLNYFVRRHFPPRTVPTYAPVLAPTLLFPCSTLPTLPCSCHACQIPVAAVPLPPPKYLLPQLSSDYPLPPVSATAYGTSPLPQRPSPLHICQKWATAPPTTIPGT